MVRPFFMVCAPLLIFDDLGTTVSIFYILLSDVRQKARAWPLKFIISYSTSVRLQVHNLRSV
jgi:hypothetical protein